MPGDALLELPDLRPVRLVTVSGRVLDLHFPPVHEVRGWVLDAEGQPCPRADGSFTIRLKDGSYNIFVPWETLRNDPEMRWVEVRGGPVDRLTLVVEVRE